MTQPQSTPTTRVTAKPASAAMEDPEHQSIVARQAILDEKHVIVGYELYNRVPKATEHNLLSDANLLFNVVSLADAQTVGAEKTLFVNCMHESLVGKHLDLIHPDRVVLELPPVEGHVSEEIEAKAAVMAELHQRGFRFAFDHSVLSRNYTSWRPFVSYVKLDREQIKPELIEPLVRYARQNTPARLIATKVETDEQFKTMLGHGIKLFQGYWFAKPVLLKSQTIRPAQAVIIQLIDLLRSDAELADIEEVLKKDPTLSFTLLKYINSSGFGLNSAISSFRHAVMMLGLQKLFRWAALLLTTTRPGGAPPAVGGTAVVRGRLMELLAAEAGTLTADECDSAFVVGVFSMLDAMLGIPMEDALHAISLPLAVIEVLLHHKGVYAPLLELTMACESGNEEVFGRVATDLKLSNRQVNWAHLQALAWAETLMD
jgi:EAL and modified HD-GYP domain-containing signal transduction protein